MGRAAQCCFARRRAAPSETRCRPSLRRWSPPAAQWALPSPPPHNAQRPAPSAPTRRSKQAGARQKADAKPPSRRWRRDGGRAGGRAGCVPAGPSRSERQGAPRRSAGGRLHPQFGGSADMNTAARLTDPIATPKTTRTQKPTQPHVGAPEYHEGPLSPASMAAMRR